MLTTREKEILQEKGQPPFPAGVVAAHVANILGRMVSGNEVQEAAKLLGLETR